MSKTLDRIATQDARISGVEDAGRDEESRYWIYLRAGWRSPADDSHTITARTVTEARQSLAAVVKCTCRDCRGAAR
jgi:hypothetical protein